MAIPEVIIRAVSTESIEGKAAGVKRPAAANGHIAARPEALNGTTTGKRVRPNREGLPFSTPLMGEEDPNLGEEVLPEDTGEEEPDKEALEALEREVDDMLARHVTIKPLAID